MHKRLEGTNHSWKTSKLIADGNETVHQYANYSVLKSQSQLHSLKDFSMFVTCILTDESVYNDDEDITEICTVPM